VPMSPLLQRYHETVKYKTWDEVEKFVKELDERIDQLKQSEARLAASLRELMDLCRYLSREVLRGEEQDNAQLALDLIR
jgi:hypothetical protein